MIFQHTWPLVLERKKTQTRRLEGLNSELVEIDGRLTVMQYTVGYPRGRIKWQVGRDYAVQPARARHALWWRFEYHDRRNVAFDPTGRTIPDVETRWQWTQARILLLDIRRERVQAITEADAIAEGCDWKMATGGTVRSLMKCPQRPPVEAYAALWDDIHTRTGERWDDDPWVWVLIFRLTEPGEAAP